MARTRKLPRAAAAVLLLSVRSPPPCMLLLLLAMAPVLWDPMSPAVMERVGKEAPP